MFFFSAPYSPVGSVETLFPGTWYLTNIDSKHRRVYDRTSPTPVSVMNGVSGEEPEQHLQVGLRGKY